MTFSLTSIDLIVFFGFIFFVIGLGIWKGRNERDSKGYFLAGRALPWWLIGISLITVNISTEQLVGMNGSAASQTGLAIASYCWIASIGLVIIAFTFLPAFLKTGVYTIPEFLEYRYHPFARSIMALITVFVYVFVNIAAVTYSGAIVLSQLFQGQSFLGIPVNMENSCWILGIISCIYVVAGGLKACAWADLLQGTALIIGGLTITLLAFWALGQTPVSELTSASLLSPTIQDGSSAVDKFFALNETKLHMFLPGNDLVLPWQALVIGLWIPNFYYWGLNQYIVQRTLAAKSLKEGQKGIVLAASLHVITPLFVVVSGLVAFNLFSDDMAESAVSDREIQAANRHVLARFEEQKVADRPNVVFQMDDGWRSKNTELAEEIARYNRRVANGPVENTQSLRLIGYKYDTAFVLLVQKLVPEGIRGFILAAIFGAIVSTLGAMLNSASSIFTMDIFRKFIHLKSSEKRLVFTGRISVLVCMLISCWVAPKLGNPKFGGIFQFMQEFQGFISPGILAAFVFGLFFKKAPPISGIAALIVNPLVYGAFLVFQDRIAFLNRMAMTFAIVLVVMGIITWLFPLSKPKEMPQNQEINLDSSKSAMIAGAVVILIVITIYVVFR